MARRHRHRARLVQSRPYRELRFLANVKLVLATRLEVRDGWSCQRCCAAAEGRRDRTAPDTPPLEGLLFGALRAPNGTRSKCKGYRQFGSACYWRGNEW